MESDQLRSAAIELERAFEATDSDDARIIGLSHELKPLIEAVKQGQPVKVEIVPGSYLSANGDLSAYPKLEAAYSRFALLVELGEADYKSLVSAVAKRKREILSE